MIISGVIVFLVLPGIDFNSNRGANTIVSNASTLGANIGGDGLQHENHTIGAIGIFAAEVDIKAKFERIIQPDFIHVPNRTRLPVGGIGEGITIAIFLVRGAIQMIGGINRGLGKNSGGKQGSKDYRQPICAKSFTHSV